MNDGYAQSAAPAALRILVRPNRSMSVAAMRWLFAAWAICMLGIGAAFTLAGAWLVLPFAGLEALLVAAILHTLVFRHADDYELIIIDTETLSVIQRNGPHRRRHDWPRYWARLRLQRGASDWHPSRLTLGSHGRFIELGAGLGEAERLALARRLRTILLAPACTTT